ncbi:MAG TPA: glycosyltransferase family protein [Rhodothermales bacterium]|nr:glycosyltransferase family protein [Rhodothermales bacterium]
MPTLLAPHPPATAAPVQTGRGLRVLFAVQGEGRGHMTQAMAVAAWLRARGHEVVGVIVGESERRAVPAFVREGLGAPVLPVPSPNFAADAAGGIRLGRTITTSARVWLTRFEPALHLVDRHVAELRPDVLVNFYEGMTGYWAARRRPKLPIVAVAHQLMFGHPAYRFAPGAPLQQAALRFYTRMTASHARARLALSLWPAPPVPRRRLVVAPPILRPEVHALMADTPAPGRALLAYVMEPGMAEGLRQWSERHPRERLHCFWDGPAGTHGRGLHFHPLDGTGFLARMAVARGVAMTAGFEAVAEAMALGKPVLMVPVPGHYEQACNALDAERAGAGIAALHFDLDRFLGFLPTYTPPAAFRAWVGGAEGVVVDAIEQAAYAAVPQGR